MEHPWTLIEAARSPDPGRFQERLLLELLRLTSAERVRFRDAYLDAWRALGTEALHAAVEVLWGGCGDDGFMDFRSWIMTQGAALYAAVLADPQTALAPWADPLGPAPQFQDAIMDPLRAAEAAGPDLTAETLGDWLALRDGPPPEGFEQTLAGLHAPEPIADIAATVVMAQIEAAVTLPDGLFAFGQDTTAAADDWIRRLAEGSDDLEPHGLTDEYGPAVRCAADRCADLGHRSHRRIFRRLSTVDSALIIPVLLSIIDRAPDRGFAVDNLAGNRFAGLLAVRRLLDPRTRRPTWLRMAAVSGAAPARAWLVLHALHAPRELSTACFDALADVGDPIATPELLSRLSRSPGDDGLLAALRQVPDAALLAVVRDAVPRLRDVDSAAPCWRRAVERLVERPATPEVLAALRAAPDRHALVAAWGLAMLGEADGEPLLVATLSADVDDRPLSIGQIVEALGRLCSAAARPFLEKRLESRADADTLLALARIDPTAWSDRLAGCADALIGTDGELAEMYEMGMIHASTVAAHRATVRQIAAALDAAHPTVAERLRVSIPSP